MSTIKKITIGVTAVIILIIGIVSVLRIDEKVTSPDVATPNTTEEEKVESNQMAIATDAVFGYEFSYPDGPDGYITLEQNQSSDPDFVAGLTLIRQHDYAVLQAAQDAMEGPPTMSLRIFTNPANLHAPVWAMQHTLESNIGLAIKEPTEAVVGGANAAHYLVDGLYPIDTYVVAHGKHVYVLTGSYFEINDTYYRDFQALVKSFQFVAPPSVHGKIDPQVACESALAYMLFTSGEDADKFVSECVAGEHPEVVEQYINNLGLDTETI